jgi:hypothetical protein
MVLALPSLRDLTLNTNEARAIRETFILSADEMTKHHRNRGEGGNNHGSSEERPIEG